MKTERPRKVYKLTVKGQTILGFTEKSLNLLCQKIGTNGTPQIEVEAGSMQYFQKKAIFMQTPAK